MKLRVLLPSVIATLVLSGYPVFQPTQAVEAVQPQQTLWRKFTSVEGGFSVLMPGKPNNFSLKLNANAQENDVRGYAITQYQGTVGYLVVYHDFPFKTLQKEQAIQLLDMFADGFVKGTKGNLLNQRRVTLKGYPGKEVAVEHENKIVKVRMYLVNQRLYIVGVEMTKEKEKNLSKSISGYLNSFTLVSK